MENFQLTSLDNNEYTLSTYPDFSFNGKLLELLPDFYSEKIIGTEQYRLLKLMSQEEGIFNTLYSNIKNFYKSLDLNKAHPRYLYLLSEILGQEIEDLSNSFDEDKIRKQREYLRQTIDRLLIKGTQESIIRFYYGLGIFLEIEELWTENYISYTPHVNKFIKDFVLPTISYNQGIPPQITELTYTSIGTEDWDIISSLNQSLSGSIGMQNITKINRMEMNNYNYIGIVAELSGGNKLYIRDNTDIWSKYDSGSYNIKDFRFHDDRILILQETATNPSLKIYRFSNASLGREQKILENVNYFNLLLSESTTYLVLDSIIDSITQIQFRNLVDFSIINYINKPFNTAISKIIKMKENEWILFDEINFKYFFLKKDNNLLSLPLLSTGYIDYSDIFLYKPGNIYINKRAKENTITMILLNPNSNDKKIYRKDIEFNNYIPRNISIGPYFTTTIDNLQDIIFLDEKSFIFLGKDGIGSYFFEYLTGYSNKIFNEVTGFADLSTHWKFIPSDSIPNIYISRTDNLGKYLLTDFTGMYFYGRSTLFKTHYYNLIVTKELSLSEDLTIITEVINKYLKNIEMGYSKLKEISFKTPEEELFDSDIIIEDKFTLSDILTKKLGNGFGNDGFGSSYGGSWAIT